MDQHDTPMKQFFLFALLASAAPLLAQHTHAPASDHTHLQHIQHCREGTVFIDNLPTPHLMEGIGNSNLTIETTSPLTQQFFNQGLSLLHCFWDLEAYRAFKEAIRHDSTALMPYWGLLHTTNYINHEAFEPDKKMALEKVKELMETANEHEQWYAEAVLFEVAKERKEYQRVLEKIVHKYPEDVEARLFLVLVNMGAYTLDNEPKSGTLLSEFLLRDLLREYPEHHGAHHYWIHQKEGCCPEEARKSAEKLASLAPNSGHIVHMPGHIYFKLGEFDQAHDYFVRAMKVDSTYQAEQGINEVDNWNYIHNIHYLLINCAMDGRYSEGLRYAEYLQNMPIIPERLELHRESFFFQGIIAPAKMELFYGYWDKAATRLEDLADMDSLYGAPAAAYRKSLLAFSTGMAAVEIGDLSLAKVASADLDAHLWRSTRQDSALQENRRFRYLSRFLNVASLELQGSLESAGGHHETGLFLLEKAVEAERELGYSEPPYYSRPVRISLAKAYAAADQYDQAIEVCEQLLEIFPNCPQAYYLLASLHQEIGNDEAAQSCEEKLKEVTRFGDPGIFSLE